MIPRMGNMHAIFLGNTEHIWKNSNHTQFREIFRMFRNIAFSNIVKLKM